MSPRGRGRAWRAELLPAGIAAGLLLAACGPETDDTTAWRSATLATALVDSQPLAVQVSYAAGDLGVRSGRPALLYEADLVWDAAGRGPDYGYDAATRTLRLAVDEGSFVWPSDAESEARLRLALSPAVPVTLHVDARASGGELDLTGLRIAGLTVDAGASDVDVRFDEPNPAAADSVVLRVRGGRMRAAGLANARAGRMVVDAEFGLADLDFGGRWTQNVAMDLNTEVARVVLRVPEDVGVALALRGPLSDAPDGWLAREGGIVESPNYAEARHRLLVAGRTSFSRVSVERLAR